MRVHLIAIHYDQELKNILGFRLLDSDTGQVVDTSYENARQVIKEGKAVIEGIELRSNELNGSNGIFERYSKIRDRSLVGNSSIVILNELGNSGYTVSDWKGTIRKYKIKDIITLSKNMGIANGKVVTKADGEKFVSAIRGSYDKVDCGKEQKERLEDKEGLTGEMEEDRIQPKREANRTSIVQIPRVSGRKSVDSKLKEIDDRTGMTVEQKLTRAIMVVRAIRPFYYSILSTVRRIESDELETMGVSVDSLYYNAEFVKKLDINRIVFVLIHEVLHLAMQHGMRKGYRIHQVWNIACDFFINKLICEEFGLEIDKPILVGSDPYGVGIGFAEGGLYNENVDIQKDTPEIIYDELIKSMEQQVSGGQGLELGSDEERQQSEGQGQGADQGQGQEGVGKDKNEESGGKDKEEGKKRKGGITVRTADMTFRGSKVGELTIVDLVEDLKSSQMTEAQKESAGRAVLERAVVLQKQMGAYGGDNTDYLERYVKEALAPRVNWGMLLRSKLSKATEETTSFASPDRRFISSKLILPGPRKVDEDTLENVKVCIDTSGSITDEELGVALAQIAQLLRIFKTEAELIYWDTRVREVAPFKSVKELVKIKPKGGRGTDVNCIFEYFESKDYRTRRKPKPSVIIIFTDGYFGAVDSKYKKYGRDTIWVLNDNDNFKAPFGVKGKLSDGIRR